MILSRAQRCCANRLVIAPPSESAQAAPGEAASAAPATVNELMKPRRSMTLSPGFSLICGRSLVDRAKQNVSLRPAAAPVWRGGAPAPKNLLFAAPPVGHPGP